MGRSWLDPAPCYCGAACPESIAKRSSYHGHFVSPPSNTKKVKRLGRFAHTVLPSGCGPLGLLILAVAKAYGVKKIVMFDIESSRTEFAEKYGATAGIVPPRNTDVSKDSLTFAQEYAKDINSKYELGNGFDITVEASGAEVCVQMAISMLKAGGTMIQAGLGKPLTAVPLFLVTAKELNIKGQCHIQY